MTLQQLIYFCKISELGTFSKAADLMFVSQPALSQQIAKLETELGVQLLMRTREGTSLTEVGRYFYEASLRILGDLDIARLNAQRSYPRAVHVLRVGALHSTNLLVLPRLLLSTIGKVRGELHTIITEGTTEAIFDGILGGRLDVGFLSYYPQWSAWPVKHDGMHFLTLAQDPVYVAHHCSIPLRTTVDVLDISPYPIISFSGGHPLRHILEKLANVHACPLNVVIEMDNVLAMLASTNENLGVCVFPETAGLEAFAAMFPNVSFARFSANLTRSLILATGERSQKDQHVKEFVSLAVDWFSKSEVARISWTGLDLVVAVE